MTKSNRIWKIAAVAVMIVTVLAGWFLAAQPLLAVAAAADADRATVEAQNESSRASIAQLTAENEALPDLKDEYEALQKSIPIRSETASFITGLNRLAGESAVQIQGITVGDPRVYSVPESAVVPEEPESTDEPAPAATATAAPVAPTGPLAPVAVTSPLITSSNFVGVFVTVEVNGQYGAVLNFVKGLQSDGRLLLVTGFSSAKNVDVGVANEVSAMISGYIYVLREG